MKRFRRALLIATVFAATAGGVSACGQEGINVASSNDSEAAKIFKENCSGCHTLSAAGTEGSTTNIRTREYKDGPNFDQRHVTVNCALYAIRNGGFSSGPMPQNIITGQEAQMVAEFIEKYSKPEVVGGGEGMDCPPPNG